MANEVWHGEDIPARRLANGDERREPGDLDGQITDLLDGLSNDLPAWRSFSQRYRGRVFCGVFLASGNEGLTLRSETLARLGERGLLIDFDIYGFDESA